MLTSHFLKQFEVTERIRKEPWPEQTVLYQPLQYEQILLAENASCLAVKTYLKMCCLPFSVEQRVNAEFMSTHGRLTKLPLLHVGRDVVSEFEPIVSHINQKELGISDWLTEEERSDMRTYVTLIENIFTMSETYLCFLDQDVYNTVTKPRYSCVFPWPLNLYQAHKKRKQVLRQLKVYQWDDLTLKDVVRKVEKCCEILETKLRESKMTFFYSDKPCDLDAIAFGHLFTVMTTKLPNNILANTVKNYPRLLDFCLFVENRYFKSWPPEGEGVGDQF